MTEKAQKIGEVVGGKTGRVYDVYYQDISGMYRISRQGETTSDIGSGLAGSPDEAIKAALDHVKAK